MATKVATKSFSVPLAGGPPPPQCYIDADCPEGYVCKNGRCVLIVEEEKKFPWPWVAIAAAVLGAIVLLSKETEKKP